MFDLVSTVGLDMTMSPIAEHLASSAGICPGTVGGTQSQPCLIHAERRNPVRVLHAVKGGGKPEVAMDQAHWRDRMPKKPMPKAK
jgi:hypothetical protein